MTYDYNVMYNFILYSNNTPVECLYLVDLCFVYKSYLHIINAACQKHFSYLTIEYCVVNGEYIIRD